MKVEDENIKIFNDFDFVNRYLNLNKRKKVIY